MKNCIKRIQRLKYAIFLFKRETGSKGLSNGNNVKGMAIWLNWLLNEGLNHFCACKRFERQKRFKTSSRGEITIDVLTHERIKLRLKFLTGLFDILE